jgi:hypothetical protein
VSDREHCFEAAMNPTLIYSWQDRLRLKEGVAALDLLACLEVPATLLALADEVIE